MILKFIFNISDDLKSYNSYWYLYILMLKYISHSFA
jgi:hypothetical protein